MRLMITKRTEEENKMKLGIIRCMQTEDYCPGSRDLPDNSGEKGCF